MVSLRASSLQNERCEICHDSPSREAPCQHTRAEPHSVAHCPSWPIGAPLSCRAYVDLAHSGRSGSARVRNMSHGVSAHVAGTVTSRRQHRRSWRSLHVGQAHVHEAHAPLPRAGGADHHRPRRGELGLRHRRRQVARLRGRHRRRQHRPLPSQGRQGRAGAGRQGPARADEHLPSRPHARAGREAHRHHARGHGRGHVRQLRRRGRRERHQARQAGDASPRHHRLPGRLPRPHAPHHGAHRLGRALPRPPRAARGQHLPRDATATRTARRSARTRPPTRSRTCAACCAPRSTATTSPPSSSSPSRARAASSCRPPSSCRNCAPSPTRSAPA